MGYCGKLSAVRESVLTAVSVGGKGGVSVLENEVNINCIQNDVTSVRRSWSSFHKKTLVYYLPYERLSMQCELEKKLSSRAIEGALMVGISKKE